MKTRPAAVAAVAVVALGVSLPGVVNDFVFDDISLIQENIRVHGLSRLGEIFTSPYWPPPFREDLYRPLASTLSAFEYVLGGGAPLVFRLSSYALYALCAVLVYRLATRLVSPAAAFGAALVFAVHPAHVEAVALGVNQGELLVGIAGLLMVTHYLDRRRAGGLAPRDWILLGVLYAVAALSKEHGFVLPGLLLAVEWLCVNGGSVRERARTLTPGFAGLAVVGALLLVARTAVLSGDVAGAFSNEAFAGLGAGARILTMVAVVPTILRLLTWPAHLQIDYGPDEVVASTTLGAPELIGIVLLALIMFAAIAVRRAAPVVTLGLLWCAIAFVLVSNVIIPTSIIIAERTLFLPSIGWILAAAAAADAAIARWPRSREVLAWATGAVLLLGATRSANRQTAWKNGARLWRISSADAPRSRRVKQAQVDAIAALLSEFRPLIAAAPEPWIARNRLATMLHAMGNDSLAYLEIEASLNENPGQDALRVELAEALLLSGDFAGAKRIATAVPVAGVRADTLRRIASLADSAASSVRPRPAK